VLDRDGTIIEEKNYLSDPEDVKLLPGAAAALRELQQMGFGLVVITNQSGIGRGFFDRERLKQIHHRLEDMLEAEGVRLDGIYACPHTPEDDCSCRKPKLGLLQKAAGDLGFSVENSIVIGDKASDIEMGRAAGALTFLVRTGYGPNFERNSTADFVVENLVSAAELLKRILAKSLAVNAD
jgi:D-glycero-D-manno-heptose 1,7-bisphosphate phosphatase